MTITLDQMLDAAEKHARTILIEKRQDELIPLFDLRDADGEGFIVGTRFTGDTPHEVDRCKDAVAQFVRDQIVEHKAVQYSFMSEAWMIVRNKNYIPGVSVRPAEADDRVEVVIAMATDGKDYLSRTWRIKRKGKRQKCVDLVLETQSGEIKPQGRFDNLLKA